MDGQNNCGLARLAVAFAAASPEKTFDLTISRGALPAEQRGLRVTKGDAVRLRLTSDAPGEMHLHGYRLQAIVTSSRPAELSFAYHVAHNFSHLLVQGPIDHSTAVGPAGTRMRRGMPTVRRTPDH